MASYGQNIAGGGDGGVAGVTNISLHNQTALCTLRVVLLTSLQTPGSGHLKPHLELSIPFKIIH